MTRFENSALVRHPVDVVFGWHERPGAFVRLTAPTLGRVVQEPTDGLRIGSRSVLEVSLPGSFGKLGMAWHARHVGYDPPHGFEDVMDSGPLASWRHRHRFDPVDGGTSVHDLVDYSFPAAVRGPAATLARRVIEPRLRATFAYRTRQLAGDLDFHTSHGGPRTFAVAGASGLVGRALVAFLGGGHTVLTLTRSGAPGPGRVRWDPGAGVLDREALRPVDVVVNLAGEPIGSRFTPEHKRTVLESRTATTGLLARTLAELAGPDGDGRTRTLVNASASGYYGVDRGDEVLTEDSGPGEGFLSQVCQAWESAADPARAAGVRVVLVRTGIVQSAAGGQLGLQLPMFEAGLGGRLGDGRAWLPWITLDDLVGLIAHLALDDSLSGPVNACAPNPVRGQEYSDTLASVLHRPAVVPVPRFGPALLLGTEGAKEMALAGQRMSADRALAWGYRFRHTDLRTGLRHVLAR